ncbi:MAG: hypothetical protein ACFCUQ_22300 [Kiloniellales bacterium]
MIEEVCNCIYEKARGLVLGQFVWYPVPHLEEVPRILDVERASSEVHFASKFEIVQINDRHFKKKEKLPIKALSLGETEELLIAKAKMRPCIILSVDNTKFNDKAIAGEIGKRRHLQDRSMTIAPAYGLATPGDPTGFPPVMTARIRALMYNQFFYLPKRCPKTGLSFGKEGIIRLDRLMAASPSRGMEAMDFRLSDEPLALLLAILRERFGGERNEDLEVARTILLEAVPPEALPVSP